jgi:hypothetical protein
VSNNVESVAVIVPREDEMDLVGWGGDGRCLVVQVRLSGWLPGSTVVALRMDTRIKIRQRKWWVGFTR